MMQWMPTLLSVLALGAVTAADPFQEKPGNEVRTASNPTADESVVRSYKMEHSNAHHVAGKLQSLFSDVQITVDEATNRIFINGPESHHQKAAPVIKELDQPVAGVKAAKSAAGAVESNAAVQAVEALRGGRAPGAASDGMTIGAATAPGESMRIFRLKHADGNEVAGLMRSLIPATRMTADARTNSIVMIGPPSHQKEVERIIESLDLPADGRTQVIQRRIESSRESEGLRAAAERLEQQARMLAEKALMLESTIVDRPRGEPREKELAQLKEAVSRAHDAKMKMYEAELRQLRERVERLEQAVQRQSAERERAVERRVEELLAERRAMEDARNRGGFTPPGRPEPPGRPDFPPTREMLGGGRENEPQPPGGPEPPRPPQPPGAPDISDSPPHIPDEAPAPPPADAGRRDAAKAKKAGPFRPSERPDRPRGGRPGGGPPAKDGPPPSPPKDDVI